MDSLLWSRAVSSSLTESRASTTLLPVSFPASHAWLSKSFSSFFLLRTVVSAFLLVTISTFIEVDTGNVNCCCW